MSLLDGQDVFGAGPHSFQPGSWRRAMVKRSFAGVDGELLIDLGMRSRGIVQKGRLSGETAAALQTILEQIEAFLDGATHSLEDNHGRTFAPVVMESFECNTPVVRGREFWCDYTISYTQLP